MSCIEDSICTYGMQALRTEIPLHSALPGSTLYHGSFAPRVLWSIWVLEGSRKKTDDYVDLKDITDTGILWIYIVTQ